MSDQDSSDERPAVREIPDSKEPGASEDDLAALDAFCKNVTFEDIDFSEWKDAGRSLDIIIKEAISSAEASAGGDRLIHFSRTINHPGRNKIPAKKNREKVSLTITWPPGVSLPTKLIFEGKGDKKGKNRGRVVIRLVLKK